MRLGAGIRLEPWSDLLSVGAHGGIAPATATHADRSGAGGHLARDRFSGWSIRAIASGLQRAVSTVKGEVARHGGRIRYRASEADQQAWSRPCGPAVCLLAVHAMLQGMVASKLILKWSPEQTSGWLKNRVSRGPEHARVPRNDLPQPIHSGPRGAEKRADRAPANQAADPPLPARPGSRISLRSDRRRHFHPGTACGKSRIAPFPVIGRAI